MSDYIFAQLSLHSVDFLVIKLLWSLASVLRAEKWWMSCMNNDPMVFRLSWNMAPHFQSDPVGPSREDTIKAGSNYRIRGGTGQLHFILALIHWPHCLQLGIAHGVNLLWGDALRPNTEMQSQVFWLSVRWIDRAALGSRASPSSSSWINFPACGQNKQTNLFRSEQASRSFSFSMLEDRKKGLFPNYIWGQIWEEALP